MQFAVHSKQLFIRRLFFISLPLLLFSQFATSGAIRAESLSPSSSFQAARNSFKAGDYEHALALFNQARADGLNKPALFYNIGVCSYKLRLYEEANQAFLHTATFPKMAALAYYNLGVVAEKQADPDTAISWLKQSLAHAGQRDEKLILLAQTALSRIRSRQAATDSWTRYVALGIGYDDNVTMVESDDLELTSDEKDSFTDIFAFVRTPLLGGSASQGPYLQGSLSFRDYTDLNEYDVGTFRLEGRYRKNTGGFKVEGGAGYNYVLWDYSGYSQSPFFNLQATHPMGDASSYRLRYEAKFHDILSSSYDYLRGWQHRATAEFITRYVPYRLVLGYSLEENDRHDNESSPRRHLISAVLKFYPVDRFSITLAATYRDTTYDLSDRDDRTEDRYETSLQFSYTLPQKWELNARYTHTINISTVPLYDFRRNMTSFSLGYTF